MLLEIFLICYSNFLLRLACIVFLCSFLAYVLHALFMSVCLSPTVSVGMGLFNLK